MSTTLRPRVIAAAGLLMMVAVAACSDDTSTAPRRAIAPRAPVNSVVSSNESSRMISVDVRAGDLPEGLTYDIPLQNGASNASLPMVAGEGRSLLVRAYDVYGALTHEGKAELRGVAVGKNEPLSVVLSPVAEGSEMKLSLDVVGESRSRGGSIVVELPKGIREGQTMPLRATVLDAYGKPMDVDPRDIHWGFTDPRVAQPGGYDIESIIRAMK